MNASDLAQRIRLGEDSTLELKRIVWRGPGKINEPNPESLADELAALGNARGGLLVLGVDDKSRDVMGIEHDALAGFATWPETASSRPSFITRTTLNC